MATRERLDADRRSLQSFAWLNPDHVKIASETPDFRHYRLRLNIDAPVAINGSYEIQHTHDMLVDLPDNYLARDHNGAFVKSRIRRDGPPIFHPNSWASDSALCFDGQFTPSKSLAEQVHA